VSFPPKISRLKRLVYRFRSAVTGRFVSGAYAERHPRTTMRERAPEPADDKT
jgi:hypothetical protein